MSGLVLLMVAPAGVVGLAFVVEWALRKVRESNALRGIPEMTDDEIQTMTWWGGRIIKYGGPKREPWES